MQDEHKLNETQANSALTAKIIMNIPANYLQLDLFTMQTYYFEAIADDLTTRIDTNAVPRQAHLYSYKQYSK